MQAAKLSDDTSYPYRATLPAFICILMSIIAPIRTRGFSEVAELSTRFLEADIETTSQINKRRRTSQCSLNHPRSLSPGSVRYTSPSAAARFLNEVIQILCAGTTLPRRRCFAVILGSTQKREPCDDCVAAGQYEKVPGSINQWRKT